MLEAPIQDGSPEAGGYGLSGRLVLLSHQDRLGRPFVVRAVDAAGRVAVDRGDAPGVQPSADPADRRMSERGKRSRRCPPNPFGVRSRCTVRCCRRGVAEDS